MTGEKGEKKEKFFWGDPQRDFCAGERKGFWRLLFFFWARAGGGGGAGSPVKLQPS